jgi:lysozyme family protein
MAQFEPAFSRMMQNEGGYKLTNIANDRGGMTYAGISRRSWPKWSGWLAVDAGETPLTSDVRDFYKKEFWDKVNGDFIINNNIASSIFNFGVNTGTRIAVKLAQIVVGVEPDGDVGPKTLEALNNISEDVFIPTYTVAKIARYRDIVKRDRTQQKFLLGWLNRSLEGAL